MLLTLRPGQGLGPFQLGASLPQVLDFLQQHKGTNEGLGFRCVEVKYSEKDTLQRDILVTFPEHGFQLHFEPGSQRLRLVEVFDTTRLQMVYGRTAVFGGASDAPTFERVYQAFGPTYQGEMDAEGVPGFYPLQYPGIMVLFLLPSQQQQQHHQGHGALPVMGGYGGDIGGRIAPSIPVPLAAVAERIFIHSGTRGPPTAVLASPPPPLEPGTHYMEPLDAVPGRGLYLGQGLSPAAVLFGDSTQDVVMQLGQPARVVPKAQAGPTAHTSSSHNPSCAPDYFYTYPSRGLDLLFCGGSHRLVKAVLHTNVPGHADFAQYCKCNFRVHPAGWQAQQERPQHSMPAGGSWEEGLSGGQALGRLPPGTEELPGPGAASVHGMPSYEEPASTGYSASSAGGPSMAKHDAAVGPDVSLLAAGGQQQQQQQRQEQQGQQEQRSGGQVDREAVEEGCEPQQPTQVGEQQGRQGQGQQEEAQQAQQEEQEQQEQDSDKPGGLTAAYHMLVGLIDDVMTLDPQKLSAGAAAAAGDASATEGSEAESPTAGSKAPGSGQAAVGASAPAGTGKPPKPPAAAAAAAAPPPPQPVCISKSSKKKKGKKARKAAAAAAAAATQSGLVDQEESGSMADVSASDSGFESSSLASSPGLVSHFIGPGRRRLGLAGGYQSSDYGSTADLAGKEGSVGAGSHLDGWSDAEDLLPMVAAAQAAAEDEAAAGGSEGPDGQAVEGEADEAAAGGSSSLGGTSTGFEVGDVRPAAWAANAPAPAAAAAPSALTAALGGRCTANGPRQPPRTSSAGVQTSDAAVGDDGSGFLACGGGPPLADLDEGVGWDESDSPQGYVIPDKPDFFDEGCGTAEYSLVPSQRDCSTQTPSHLISPPLRGGVAAAAGRVGPAGARGQPPSGNGALGAAVTSDSRLEDIESVFGHQGGPVLHNRLGSSHPFGPSYLYAYRGVVFEVLQNGLIATVTLFRP